MVGRFPGDQIAFVALIHRSLWKYEILESLVRRCPDRGARDGWAAKISPPLDPSVNAPHTAPQYDRRQLAAKGAQMLRGLTTVSLWAADLAAAKKWYAELLGIDPYFERPGYAEFRLGDYQHELGLIDSRYAPHGSATGPAGAVVYWHVDDVTATLKQTGKDIEGHLVAVKLRSKRA